MEPLLQWVLGIYATLSVTAVIVGAKSLYSIDKKVALFIQSAEMRFESHEKRIEALEGEEK